MGIRTGTVSLCVTGRIDPAHSHAPWFFVDGVSSAFLQDCYNVTPMQFAMELENYSLLGRKSLARNANDQRVAYKRSIRNSLQVGLCMWSSSCSHYLLIFSAH